MLSEFLLLERYFEKPDRMRCYEDLEEKYGTQDVQSALEAGYIACKRSYCSSIEASMYLYLTDLGRHAALRSFSKQKRL